MLLGVISDTHGHTRNTLAAIHLFESFDVERVLHCGDLGGASVPKLFSRWPTHFVLGNVDRPAEELQAAIEAAGQTYHGRFGSLELAGKRIAFLHGDDVRLWQATIASGEWDLVCYGHTHKPESRTQNGTLVLNPGAVYRANPHSVAVVNLPALDVEFLKF